MLKKNICEAFRVPEKKVLSLILKADVVFASRTQVGN